MIARTTVAVSAAAAVLLGTGVVQTNLVALRLRDHLMGIAPVTELVPLGHVSVRSDVAVRWNTLFAEPAGEPLKADSPHGRAALIARRDWVAVASVLERLAVEDLRWRGVDPVPPSASGAVLQRAAEQLAKRDVAHAARLAVLARQALQAHVLEPDWGNLETRAAEGDTIAELAERDRLSNTAKDDVLANASLSAWAPVGGRVPGWTAASASVEFALTAGPAAALTVCAVAGEPEGVLVNDRFRPSAGSTYRLRGNTELLSGTATAGIFVGVRFREKADGPTVGVYARPTATQGGRLIREVIWTAPPLVHDASFIVGLQADNGRTCVAFSALAAQRLDRR
jgi:hypothetical protein